MALEVRFEDRRLAQDHVEERLQVFAFPAAFGVRDVGGKAVATTAVHHRELEQVVIGAEVDEQLEDLVVDPFRATVGTVDLVDHDHRLEPALERFLEHEARLRHRAFACVDQEQDRVGHVERALDLTAKVGVARRVDDVDAHAFIIDRGVLGENRDATLALLIVRVHDALGHLLMGAKRASKAEHGIDQGCLAVVDVSDDGNVPDRDGSEGRHDFEGAKVELATILRYAGGLR